MLRPPPAKSSREQCRSRPPLPLKPVGCFPRLALTQRSRSAAQRSSLRLVTKQDIDNERANLCNDLRRLESDIANVQVRSAPVKLPPRPWRATHTRANSHNRRACTDTRRRTHADDDGANARAPPALCAHCLPATNKRTKRAPRCNTTPAQAAPPVARGSGRLPRRPAGSQLRTSYNQCRPSVNMDTYV